MKQCICLGDSLTLLGFQSDGWATLLSNRFKQIKFTNRGFGGYTSRQILYSIFIMLPPPLLKKVDVVTLLIGTNDCLNLGNPKGVSSLEYGYNLTQIINYILFQNKNINIYLITPPTIRNNVNIIKYKNSVLVLKGFHKQVSIINLYAPIKQTQSFTNIDL
jgi:lysophospholipase L1-like esterase